MSKKQLDKTTIKILKKHKKYIENAKSKAHNRTWRPAKNELEQPSCFSFRLFVISLLLVVLCGHLAGHLYIFISAVRSEENHSQKSTAPLLDIQSMIGYSSCSRFISCITATLCVSYFHNGFKIEMTAVSSWVWVRKVAKTTFFLY